MWLSNSSVGRKVVMSVTGIALVPGNSGWAAAFLTRRPIRSFWPSASPQTRPLIRITGL